jgi:Ca2+-binding EF-hand superfamily protein
MNQIDTNNDGVISTEEFKAFTMEQDIKLREVFNSIDKDGSGLLNQSEVNQALMSCGTNLDEDAL